MTLPAQPVPIEEIEGRAAPGGRRGRLASPPVAAILGVVVVVLALAYVPITVAATDGHVIGIPRGTLVEIVVALAFACMGVLVARRRPGHPAGWMLLGIAIVVVLMADGSVYALLDYRNHRGALPLGPVAELLNLLWLPGILLIPVVVVAFPDGQLPSPRWRWGIAIYVVVGGAFVVAFYAIALADVSRAGVVIEPSTGDIAEFDNPVGTLGLLYLGWAMLVALGSVAALCGIVINYSRSVGERRQQLKWFMLGAGVFVLVALPTAMIPNSAFATSQLSTALFGIALLAPPLTVAIGILRYRLYDIDVVINRAIVYASLAAFITTVYVGIAVGIGAVVGGGGRPNLALSILATAIVAVGFQPVRERVQRVANRLVYGQRATPYEVLSQFSARVAESYSMQDLMPRMARVLAEGTGAARADVWLHSGAEWRDAAVWPPDAAPAAAQPASHDSLPRDSGASRVVEVRHQGALLGALSVAKRPGESLTPVEENLLEHLAGQAGLVMRNVGLTSDLQARLEELRASRQRLVGAQDEERRRLERNLHDGAQQHLVALKVKLGLAEMLMARDVDKAKITLEQLKGDAEEALETLRDLARGIYPPLLADKGLPLALESQARKATVAVTVVAEGLGRYSQDVEAAVYFSILEALQNVQKYAQASAATVLLEERDGMLTFTVRDDGRGFDTASTARGSGLTNMADRLDALGGTVALRSAPGTGTELSGAVPVYEATRAADQASARRSGLNSDLEMKPAAPTSSA